MKNNPNAEIHLKKEDLEGKSYLIKAIFIIKINEKNNCYTESRQQKEFTLDIQEHLSKQWLAVRPMQATSSTDKKRNMYILMNFPQSIASQYGSLLSDIGNAKNLSVND